MKTLTCFICILEIIFNLFLFSTKTKAQTIDFVNFSYLKSEAPVPADFQTTYLEKIKEDREKMRKSENEFEMLNSERFVITSNFVISRLLQSGKILFNDPVTIFINHVADSLLKPFPELRKELRFYAVKSPEVNAFATDKGIIFVNLGLISRLHNEAELAFVLAHEIVHFVKKHNINLFIEKEKIESKRAEYQGLDLKEKVLMKHFRSKEMELEADLLGVQDYYSLSSYEISVYEEVFTILQFSYLPVKEKAFEKSFLESEYLKIPDEYWLEELKPINQDVDTDDSLETHPNIIKRRAIIKEFVDKGPAKGKKLFVNPEPEFQYIKKLAAYECLRQWLIDCEYAKAFVNAKLMLDDFSENEYIQSIIAWSLYGLTKYKNVGRLNEVMTSYRKIEGESQQIHFLFSKLKKQELTVIALNYTWRLHRKYPENKVVEKLSKALFDELTGKNKLTLADFQTEREIVSTDSINKPKNVKKNKRKPSFIHSAFTDLLADSIFRSELTFYANKNQKRIEIENEEEEIKIFHKPEIDKIVVVNPFCIYVDESKEDALRFLDSYEMQLDYKLKLQNLSQKMNMKLTILENAGQRDFSVQDYNDFSLIREWISERLENENMICNEFMEDDMQNIIEKYQTPYFCLSGFYSVKSKPSYFRKINSSLFYSVLFTPVWGLTYIFGPDYYTEFYTLVFDVRSGETVTSDYRSIGKKASDSYLSSNIYDILYQLKSKEK